MAHGQAQRGHDHGHSGHHGHGHDGHDGHHGHGHHGHVHGPASFGRAFATGTILNATFVIVEAIAGVIAGSTALLADAGHNLGDVLGLVIAWIATVLAKRRPSGRYTYGLRSSSILAAMLNALLLLVAITIIAVEAVGRLFDPAPVAGWIVVATAAAGIVVNGSTALLFMAGRKGDLNVRGAFLHMATDAAISAGVVIAGVVIALTGWRWLDPVASLLVVAVVAAASWSLLRDSVNMSLMAAPPGLDPAAVERFLLAQDGVAAIHDLHVWPMSTTETALTVHLLVPAGYPGDGFTAALAAALGERFGIGHATVQVETDAATGCLLEHVHAR